MGPGLAEVDGDRLSRWALWRDGRPDTDRRPFWRRRPVVTAVALLVILVAAAFGRMVATYEPFAAFEKRGGSASVQGDAVIDSRRNRIYPDEFHVSTAPGGELIIQFSLHNGGRWPVRLTGVSWTLPHMHITGLGFLKTWSGDVDAEPLGEGARFDPGQGRDVEVSFRMVRCFGGFTSRDDLRLHYEVFGISRSQDWQLPYGLVIDGEVPGCVE